MLASPPTEREQQLDELLARPDRGTILSILELLDPLSIALRVPDIGRGYGKYSALLHAELCRLKMLGFTDANCATGVGIRPETLRDWFTTHPQLELDMQQAAQLANAEVAKLLFAFMTEKGPVGLNAVKFFLSTRTEEFREKAEVEVKGTSPEQIKAAIGSIYGVTTDGKAGSPPSDD